MFSGIVQNSGKVTALQAGSQGAKLSLTLDHEMAVAAGSSISVDGVCLTAREAGTRLLTFDLSPETLEKTTLGAMAPGQQVNIEPALRLGDELGGHLVAGHIDGLGTVVAVEPQGQGCEMTFEAPAGFEPWLADKGSVAVNGVSLTVIKVNDRRFGAALIPHTLTVTGLGRLKAGDKVNLEADLIARYVARQWQWQKGQA